MTQKSTLLISIFVILLKITTQITIENACTFRMGGKLFSLIYLQKPQPYKFQLANNQTVYINFCTTFTPSQCPKIKSAHSFSVVKYFTQKIDENNQTIQVINYNCTRYSSNSYTALFSAKYIKQGNGGTLEYLQHTQPNQQLTTQKQQRKTLYNLQCATNTQLIPSQIKLTQSLITIQGSTKYGCPIFSVSSIWRIFQDNWILIGIVLFVMGLHLLFFGRTTIETTIFIAGFLIIFSICGAIFTIFVGPYSSTFVIYFAFLALLFISTLIAYGVTKLVGVSIFFVGAILGFIIGMLVNSIFCSIFNIYSVWSLVVFQIFFTIPFGLLTFRYQDQIIIASSSLTGAYFVIRPISWIFGGFPNQFLLYQMVQTKQVSGLPWTFFLYLVFIIAIAIVGQMYQIIKLRRQDPSNQIQTNFIQQGIQQPIDMIKMKVDKLIDRFKSDKEAEDYRRMSQLKDTEGPRRKSQTLEYPIVEQYSQQLKKNQKKQIQRKSSQQKNQAKQTKEIKQQTKIDKSDYF